jgi:hypothetical protein
MTLRSRLTVRRAREARLAKRATAPKEFVTQVQAGYLTNPQALTGPFVAVCAAFGQESPHAAFFSLLDLSDAARNVFLSTVDIYAVGQN